MTDTPQSSGPGDHPADDEFYVGWRDKAPPATGRFVKRTAAVLIAAAAILGGGFALVQHTIGTAVFEHGETKRFEGRFERSPYPHLLVPRPGAPDGPGAFSRYSLVATSKFGIDPGIAAELDGRWVVLEGTLIYRDDQTMVEVAAPPRTAPEPTPPPPAAGAAPVSLGTQTFQGEIVDAKCYLGVMNPGRLEPHRACAVRCISGGVPPVLLVRQNDGTARYLMLSDPDGAAVNDKVLDLVAEPVEITGDVEQHGDRLVLKSDPATYRRLRTP